MDPVILVKVTKLVQLDSGREASAAPRISNSVPGSLCNVRLNCPPAQTGRCRRGATTSDKRTLSTSQYPPEFPKLAVESNWMPMSCPAQGSLASTLGTRTWKSTRCVFVGNNVVLLVTTVAATVTMLLEASR